MSVFQFGDQFTFIRFATVAEHFQSVRLRNAFSDYRFFLCRQFKHLRLAKFIAAFEDITILDPKETRLVADQTAGCTQTKLFVESLLRRTPATDNKIHIAQDAAMDLLPYQLAPTTMALSSTRPRILIADAVGIGKTLEAGILVSELIERGRGKRILVLTVKAMLEQFQQEFWNRFSIPLTRLDSAGLQRLQQRIPASHNPFHYVDRAIISIDTLKQTDLYRTYIEKAYWDIILVDEAHNVADRGTQSLRSKLARLLAQRSDALIMLSATPHDGKPESFASLIDMLDPTVISNPKHYTVDDFKGRNLVIRRFKNDIRDDAQGAFLEREISTLKVPAAASEEAAFEALQAIDFKYIDSARKGGTVLFRTTLEKALFSSPAACAASIKNRIKTLSKKTSPEAAADVEALEHLQKAVERITPKETGKYQKFVSTLLNSADPDYFGWTGKDPEDRLVVFTESRQTLDFLAAHLPKALGLGKDAVVVLKGDDADRDLMAAVEQFNNRESPVRLMLATDVASEGLNLHYLCHRLVHYDIPWSLMVFQQRNGRIDRYGQTKQPLIRYLQTVPSDEANAAERKIKGDVHVLELLIEKDQNAASNIGDPREFAGSQEEQEKLTALRMQGESLGFKDADAAEGSAEPSAAADAVELFDPFADLADSLPEAGGDVGLADAGFNILDAIEKAASPKNASGLAQRGSFDDVKKRELLFPDDYAFLKTALELRRSSEASVGGFTTDLSVDDARKLLKLSPPRDLEARLQYLPREVLPEDGRFVLTSDKARVMKAIRDAGSNPNSSWPSEQLLWELHPVMQWMEDWAIGSFGRHAAPVVCLDDRLAADETWVLLQGGCPNFSGATPVHDWIAVKIAPDGSMTAHPRRELMARLNPAKPFVNRLEPIETKRLVQILPNVVNEALKVLRKKRDAYEAETKPRLEAKLKELERLKNDHAAVLEEARKKPGANAGARLKAIDERSKYLDQCFESAKQYEEKSLSLDSNPFVQVVAVFCGSTAPQFEIKAPRSAIPADGQIKF